MKVLKSSVLVVISVLFLSADAAVDEYKVIKVMGDIIYKNSGKHMETGDVFEASIPLEFKTEKSRAAVISKNKGRFVLAPPSKSQTTNLVPAVNTISSRSGAIVNAMDMRKHFEGEYLIIDRVEIPVSSESFPQDDQHFFFMSYQYNEEKIMKKLEGENGKLIIDRSELFTIDGTEIDPFNTEMNLYYRDANAKENTQVAMFEGVFPSEELLEKEVAVILEEYEDFDKQEKFKQVKGYLTEFYGKPFDPSLKDWLSAFQY
ncbi:MAG: hypothetical protein ACQERC_07350 [Bacteroidota bacterium]